MAVTILMYHGTPNGIPDDPYDVSLENFRAQIDAVIDSGAEFIRFSEAGDSRKLSKGKHVSITFDDGNTNNIEAISYLSDRGIVAAEFVVADWSGLGLGYKGRTDYLSKNDLADLAQICEIGGHGATHRPMSEIPANELDGEFRASIDFVGQAIGAAPTIMSFPGGVHDDRVVRQARAAGFQVLGNSIFDINTKSGPTLNRLVVGADANARSVANLVRRPAALWQVRRFVRKALGR